MCAQPISIVLDTGTNVSGLIDTPPQASACYIFAHGAGAGMSHLFMEAVAAELAQRHIAVLRFQFPYMERTSKRPDPPKVAHAAVRAAVAEARHRFPQLPLFAGGKSYGGRMVSQAQAGMPLDGVLGLAFVGFPLHPANRPSRDRAEHLFGINIPMLFLQGTRDALADLEQLEPLRKSLGRKATLKLFNEADHSLHVPKRTGQSDGDVRREMVDAMVIWIDTVVNSRQSKH
jgi:predicted alpha/beta-hydrolase family hydrolase